MTDKTNQPPDWKPIPDPLTHQLIALAIKNFTEKLETRLDAIDKATALSHADATRRPTEMDRQIGHLKELFFAEIASLKKK